MGIKKTQGEYIKEVSLKHAKFYNYEKTYYTGGKYKVLIKCPIHDYFSQRADMHARGQGCPICAKIIVGSKVTYSNEQFIEEARKVHLNKNEYERTLYISSKKKVTITCNIHGDFEQTPNSHLSGNGCPKCGKESHWRKSDYIKKAKGRICTFYILRCFSETEEFYKIGITMNNIKRRYNGIRYMPYLYEIVLENKGEAGAIYNIEKDYKIKLKDFKYAPEISFGGSITECFTQYKI
jgi:hypothetical protein